MAVKVGEAYYDVSPRYNRAAAEAMNAQIDKNMRAQSQSSSKILDDAHKKTFDQDVKNLAYLDKLHQNTDKQEKARFQESLANINKSISAQKSLDNQRQSSIAQQARADAKNLADRNRAEVQAYREDSKRTVTKEKERQRIVQQTRKDDNEASGFRRLLAAQEDKQNEGFFHKTATHFRTIGTLARGLALGSAITGSYSLLVDSLGAISAAAPIAAAGVALIPVAIGGVIAEGLILKGAFRGVGKSLQDAFDPTKAAQFQKDLQGLSPAARSFVQEIAKAKGVLPNIQQTFFSSPQLQAAGSRVRGFFETIKGNFKNLIATNGDLFGRLLGDVTSKKGASQISDFLGNINRFLKQITPGVAALGRGFITFMDNASKSISGSGINKFLTSFGKWIAQINTAKLFAAATAAFHGFAYVAGQLWGILTGIFKSLGGADHLGATFFKNIGGLLHTIDVFVNSKNGQTFLHQLEGTLNVLSNLANSAIKSALTFLAGAFAALYPSIKPFADIIKKILKDLEPLGPVVGTILAGAFRSLTKVLTDVEPWIRKVVDYIANHKQQVADFANKVLLVVAAYAALKKAISVAQPVMDLVGALKGLPAPALAALAAFALLAAAVIYTYNHSALFRDLVKDLKTNLDKLLGSVGGLKGAFNLWASAVKGIVMGFLIADVILLNGLIIGLTKTIEGVKRAFDDMKHWMVTGWDAVKAFFVTTMPNWFVALGHGIEAHFNEIIANFHSWYSAVVNFFTGTVANFFTRTIPGWFGSMRTTILSWWNTVRADMVNFEKGVVGFFTGTLARFFTNTIPGWVGSLRRTVASWWGTIRADMVGFEKGVVSFFTGTLGAFFTKTVPGWVGSLRRTVLSWWGTIRGDMVGFEKGVVSFFTTTIGTFFTKTVPSWWGVLRRTVLSWWTTIRADMATFRNAVVNFFTIQLKNFIVKTIPGWFGTARAYVLQQFDLIRNRISSFVSHDVKGVFSTIYSFLVKTVPGWFGTLKKNVLTNLHNLVVDIQNIWTTVSNVFKEPVMFAIRLVIGGAHGLISAWNSIAGHLPGGGHLKITPPTFSDPGPPPKVAIPAYAYGGQAPYGMVNRALGGPTQDNVNINVSGGEYITKASSVAAIQRAAPGYLDALNKYGDKAISGDPSGIHIFDPRKQRYSVGGPVNFGGNFASGGSAPRVTPVGKAPTAISMRVPGTLAWLKSIAGRVPYVLGSNGPNAFDCSSLVGAVWARLTGHNPNHRYFVTGTENNWLLGHGFSPGADPSGFTVGLTSPPEHTVGMLAGHRFEAAHTGTRMRFDGAAANALGFSRRYHMTSVTGLGGSFGLPAILQAVSTSAKFLAHMKSVMGSYGPGPQTSFTPLVKSGNDQIAGQMNTVAQPLIQKLAAQAEAAAAALAGFAGGGGPGSSSISLQEKWIAEAAKYVNIPASWIPGILTIIRRESGGNPNSVNHTDRNAREGHPSQGLMQTIPSTFLDNVPISLRHLGILNPVANIAAAVNYIHKRYGTIFRVQQANPRLPPKGYSIGGKIPKGYAKGTGGAAPGWAWVGEEGPELMKFGGGETVIPNKVATGYAKGTKPIGKSLQNDVRNISSNFIKSSSVIATAVNTLTNAILNDVTARARRGNIITTIKSAGTKLEKLSDSLKSHQQTLKDLQSGQKATLQTNVSNKISGLGDLTALSFDPYETGGAAAAFVPQLQTSLTRAKTYAANIKKVKTLGLSATLISALASSDSGEAIINSLASGSKTNISKINSLSSQITSLASTSSASVAGAVYNSSIAAQTKEIKKLTAEMKKLSNGLEGKVAKRLGIHRALGGYVPQVAGISGDNVPLLATAGEYVVPVGGNHNNSCNCQTTVIVDGVDVTSRAHVVKNNRGVIDALGRRTGK